MSETESRHFENADLISLASIVEKSNFSVKDEIDRGLIIYNDRRRLKEQQESEIIKPLYASKQKTVKTKPPYYYKLICEEHRCKPNYEKCKHTGTCILDRDILTRQEHDIFLSQPKVVAQPKQPYRRCHYVKKYFSPCTNRTEQLALPKKQKLSELWNEHGEKMSPEKAENIAKLIVGPNFTSIERTIALCKNEKKKKLLAKRKISNASRRIQKKIIEQKKRMIRKISLNIFKAMKEFLMSEQDLGFNTSAKILSDVIARRIFVFGRYDQVARDSDDVLAKCVYGLADSLAVWVQKITEVCSFGQVVDHSSPEEESANVCSCNAEQHAATLYPIDDYIEYQSTSSRSEFEYDTSHNIAEEMLSYEGLFERDDFSNEMRSEGNLMSNDLDKIQSVVNTNLEKSDGIAPAEGSEEIQPESATDAPIEATPEAALDAPAEATPEATPEAAPEVDPGEIEVPERVLPSPEP